MVKGILDLVLSDLEHRDTKRRICGPLGMKRRTVWKDYVLFWSNTAPPSVRNVQLVHIGNFEVTKYIFNLFNFLFQYSTVHLWTNENLIFPGYTMLYWMHSKSCQIGPFEQLLCLNLILKRALPYKCTLWNNLKIVIKILNS